MKNIGFKTILITSISLITAVSVGVSNYMSHVNSSETLQETIYETTKKRVDLEATALKKYLDSNAHAVESLAEKYRTNKFTENHVSRLKLVNDAVNGEATLVGFNNGEAYTSAHYAGWVNGKNPESYDPRNRPWYPEAMNNNNVVYTDVYEDSATQTKLISIGKNFGYGVILADVTLDVLSELVERIDIPGSVTVVITEDTTILASNSSAIKTGEKMSNVSSVSNLVPHIVGKNKSYTEYQLDGKDKVLFSQEIKLGNKSWYLAICLEKDIVFSALTEAKEQAIFSTIGLTILAIIIAFVVLRIIYQPILTLKETIISLSNGDGDLTQRLEVKNNDDLGQIAGGVNRFIESLQTMMIDIQAACNSLQSNIDIIHDKAEQNENILSRHVIETEQVVTAIEEMSVTANQVAINASETAQVTQEANSLAEVSKAVVGQAQLTVESLVSDVDEAANNVQTMSTETQGISEILDVIGGIADQTNLLALNAAIEAARAGEQGRGFAVVADEVRTLAARTQSSTTEIEDAIKRLLVGNESVVNAMNATKERCEETQNGTIEVTTSLESMTTHVSKINDLSIQIATAAEEQNSVTEEITRNVSSISDMVGTISQNADENLQQAQSIAALNNQLIATVNKFKIK